MKVDMNPDSNTPFEHQAWQGWFNSLYRAFRGLSFFNIFQTQVITDATGKWTLSADVTLKSFRSVPQIYATSLSSGTTIATNNYATITDNATLTNVSGVSTLTVSGYVIQNGAFLASSKVNILAIGL